MIKISGWFGGSSLVVWILAVVFATPATAADIDKPVDLLSPAQTDAQSNLDIAPYIQQLTPTTVTVKWQTRVPPQSRCMLRKMGENTWVGHNPVAVPVMHEVRIDNLTPDAHYEFYADIGPGLSRQTPSQLLSFRTPPTQSDSVIFAVYGDTRSQPLKHEKVIAAMTEKFADRIELLIHTGDIVGNGLHFDSWAREFFTPARRILSWVPVYPVLGNHENNSLYYFDFFNLPGNERWYSFDRGPVHIIFLDSYFSDFAPGSKQYQWLRNDLANCRSPWKIVALHTPFFTSGPHGKLKEDGTPGEREIAGMQTHIQPILDEYDVTMVFSGHDHFYERSTNGNIHYVIAGGGGAPLYGATDDPRQNPYSRKLVSQHHYCIVEATKNEFTMRAYNLDGMVFDEVTLTATPTGAGR